MFELIDTHPDLNVQEAEYRRLLGYPAQHDLEGRSGELANWARQWYREYGRPWIYARQTGGLDLTAGTIRVQGAEFASRHFHEQLSAAQAHDAVLVAVSAGSECESQAHELWQEGKPDEYFFLEMFGSAVVEHLVANASGRVCAWAENNGMRVLPHYSPGYSGWEMADQIKLGQLLRHANGSGLPGFLQVLDTGMLRPKKSLLAVSGLTRHVDRVRPFSGLVPCHNCSLPGCQYRRAPYQHFLPQIEDVRRLQPTAREAAPGKHNGDSVLDASAKYSVNLRALRKWSQERLQLQTRPDGSVEARFRYEGTTCSNLGRPLEFQYHVRLGPPAMGYRIVESSCAPAPGDTGHTAQCEYLNDAPGLMRSIADEKPLLGLPLSEVLTWQRAYNPSGCYCDRERRDHKWGLVLEVIHYALAQLEQNPREERQIATSRQ